MSKPSGGIRSLPSLSACGSPTPVVALACIGNVDIQVLSCADGESYFLRRLQAGGRNLSTSSQQTTRQKKNQQTGVGGLSTSLLAC